MTATITGTMLTPGVSLNKRLYTKEQIAKTVARMRERIADPAGLPLSMRTHHDAGDDSLRIIGRVTDVTVDPKTGDAIYKAVLNTTTEAGHDMWQLIRDRKNPLLDSTSIYGWWLGEVRQVDHEGERVDVGDDLEVDAIDFTGSPGVAGARIRTVSTTEQHSGETAAQGRHIVTETITAQAITEEAPGPAAGTEHVLLEDGAGCATCLGEAKDPKQPYGSVTYADPGYQKDKVKRYPLDTKAHVKAALAYIAVAKNAAKYTAQQLASIKGKINAAAKKLGITTASDSATRRDVLTESVNVVAVTEWAGPGCCGFSISAFNGPLTVSVSAYDGIEAGDMPLIARAAMDAALQAIRALDPDEDGDVDVPGKSKEDTTEASDYDGAELPDDALENRTYSVQATAEGPVTINITPPSPRTVAAMLARRKIRPAAPAAAAETAPAAAKPPAGPAGAPPATTDDAAAASDSSATATTKEQNTMPDTNTAPEETAAPPAPLNEDALKAFAGALGPVIGAAVETAVTKALAARETATPEAKPAAETAPEAKPAAPAASDATVLAEAVKASLDGLPAALAEAIKPLIPAAAPAAAAAEPANTTAPAEGTQTPAAEAAAAPVDPKHVALEAARMAIPELLEAFGVPRRKGLVPSSEHRGSEKQQTPEDLWANRSQMWDQLIPQAPAAVQQTPAALAAAAAAPLAAAAAAPAV
jgi:hypothetical protein